MPDDFQIAAARAAASYPKYVWHSLTPSQQVAAIYRESRMLDSKKARQLPEYTRPQSRGR
jgi:hypothetical protein